MKFRIILNKIEWRKVLIYLIAIWLFSEALQTFFYFSNVHFLKSIIVARKNGLTEKNLITESNGIEFLNFYYYSTVGSIIGFFTGFLISLLLSIKQKWAWLNSILSLAISYILSWIGLIKSYFLKSIVLFPGIIFKNNISLTISINASILLFLGIFAFFLSRINTQVPNPKTSIV